ncbi:MAG: YigZ family protein, partial [Firmicutes bacterium]|nr:YigZ family protein [Bacillota bacterium]
MKSLSQKTEKELIVDKSRFIALLFPLAAENEIKPLLEQVKREHPDARHIPYAYRYGTQSRASDDGEPSGSAGRPLLDLLTKKDLDQVLLFVVRYFGGVKLGAGRLLRTFSLAGKDVIAAAHWFELMDYRGYRVTLSYENFESLKRLARENDAYLTDIVYNDTVV